MVPYFLKEHSLTVLIRGVPRTIYETHPNYQKVLSSFEESNRYTSDEEIEEEILKLVDLKESIRLYSSGGLKVVEGQLVDSEGHVLHGSLVERILKLIRAGEPYKYLVRFLENLYNNPSRTAIDELYLFLEKNDMPITDDGCFVAYKGVRDNYKDFWTNSIDNSVGQIVSMPRHDVDDIRDNVCSYGLHAGRYNYASAYKGSEGRLMIVKINPADVVSIPSDYDNAKLRTCRYEVIGEVEEDTLKDIAVYEESSSDFHNVAVDF